MPFTIDSQAAFDLTADMPLPFAFFHRLSRSFQAAMRLAFSRDSLVEP